MRTKKLITGLTMLPLVGGLALAIPATSANAAPPIHPVYVSTKGSDRNPGTEKKPFATVQKAVDVALPGDSILIYAGTYNGAVSITKSGTAVAPITIGPAGNGPVTLATNYPAPPCGASGPTHNRTFQFDNGADYWTISGLNIVGGIDVAGRNSRAAFTYFKHLVTTGDWQTRRAIPGRGSNDPVAARTAFSYLSTKLGVVIDPSDGLRFINNTITRRGIIAVAARYGTVAGNTIHNVDCGTGPGLWINLLSDGWSVRDNHIYDIKPSTYKHYMQEGIRLGSGSNYSTVERNLVEDLQGDGRAVNTDVDASWSVFQRNTARNVNIGFNDQMSGWGNKWAYNTAAGFRTSGFNFRGLDSGLTTPSMNSSTYKTTVICNKASNGPTALNIGAIKSSTFTNNYFSTVVLGPYVAGYWAAQGNIWNGSKNPPPARPALPPAGAC